MKKNLSLFVCASILDGVQKLPWNRTKDLGSGLKGGFGQSTEGNRKTTRNRTIIWNSMCIRGFLCHVLQEQLWKALV